MFQKSRETIIALFVKKSKASKKRKIEDKMKNIDGRLDYLSLTGCIINAISEMEHIPANTWNIGMESNKYGAGLDKINCIDTDCINKIRNRIIIKNIKVL